jgi:hypothetical protein
MPVEPESWLSPSFLIAVHRERLILNLKPNGVTAVIRVLVHHVTMYQTYSSYFRKGKHYQPSGRLRAS